MKHLSNIAGILGGEDVQNSSTYFRNPVNLCNLTDSSS